MVKQPLLYIYHFLTGTEENYMFCGYETSNVRRGKHWVEGPQNILPHVPCQYVFYQLSKVKKRWKGRERPINILLLYTKGRLCEGWIALSTG